MFEFEEEQEPIVRSEAHKTKHQMFGLFVCTGMAHLVMTTFDVPGISYIRVFLVGAMYVALGLSVKLGHERAILISLAVAMFSMIGSTIEYAITGSHPLANLLVIFDVMTVLLYMKYQNVKDLPLPEDNTTDSLSSG